MMATVLAASWDKWPVPEKVRIRMTDIDPSQLPAVHDQLVADVVQRFRSWGSRADQGHDMTISASIRTAHSGSTACCISCTITPCTSTSSCWSAAVHFLCTGW